jgi:hypothetical protein
MALAAVTALALAQPAVAATHGTEHQHGDAAQVLGYHACTDANPCHVAGTYVLGAGTVAPGLRLTVPAGGWTINHVTAAEVNLIPPGAHGAHGDRMGMWVDPIPVQPDGPMFGTPLTRTPPSPHDLITSLESQGAFTTTPARPVVLGHTFPAKSLDLRASATAHSPDPDCPAAPRCVNVFTTAVWLPTDPPTGGGIGIAGDETLRLNVGGVRIDGARHTLIVGLDAITPADLAAFQVIAAPIEHSLRVPRPMHLRSGAVRPHVVPVEDRALPHQATAPVDDAGLVGRPSGTPVCGADSVQRGA